MGVYDVDQSIERHEELCDLSDSNAFGNDGRWTEVKSC